MRFVITFFPDAPPDKKDGRQYFAEALRFVELAEALGFDSVKIVEHYFTPYGGYSPDPIPFLAAASQVSRRMRLMTGAVIPAFNHPLKLAGQIGMLDCISGGRLDVGVARAFLPHEFDSFEVSMEESRARFEEGVGALLALLSRERVTLEGKFHRFHDVTSLPRPVQKPHPPLFVAAFRTADSFLWAGREGHHIMISPFYLRPAELGEMVRRYRKEYAAAGHTPGREVVNINFRLFARKSDREAREQARPYVQHYIEMLLLPLRAWKGRATAQYPGYEAFVSQVESFPYDAMVEQSFIGSPEAIARRIEYFTEICGGEIYPSVDFNFGLMDEAEARESLTLFAREVMPKLR